MKQLEVIFSPASLRDMQGIYHWISIKGQGPRTAERFTHRIEDRCLKIGGAPMIGRERDDLLPGLRTIPFERSVVIAYRILADGVEIVNIFGAGRDYEAFYLDDDERG